MDSLAALHHELGIPDNYARSRGWPLQREAAETELISIGQDVFGRDQRMTHDAAQAWHAMRAAAHADDVILQPVSAYRSVQYQIDLIRRKLDAGRNIDAILKINAVPGYSEHHTGRAVDITTPDTEPLEDVFETTPAFQWLQHNAAHHNFHLSYPRNNHFNMAYEPWHWAWQEKLRQA